jgi:hypothetical protein
MRSIASSALKALGMKDDDVERVSTEVVAEIASREACQGVKEDRSVSYVVVFESANRVSVLQITEENIHIIVG